MGSGKYGKSKRKIRAKLKKRLSNSGIRGQKPPLMNQTFSFTPARNLMISPSKGMNNTQTLSNKLSGTTNSRRKKISLMKQKQMRAKKSLRAYHLLTKGSDGMTLSNKYSKKKKSMMLRSREQIEDPHERKLDDVTKTIKSD